MMTRSRHKSITLNREDRLSSLPDALVTHILSFISTKDSVRTSVLSTRWKYLFASVPALSLSHANSETGAEFVRFVSNILRVHNVSSIRLFRLLVRDISLDSNEVYSWICGAVLRNARRIIVIVISLIQPCPLPPELFTSQILVDLKLSGEFVFGVIGTVYLTNLKTLFISRCIFKDGDSAKRFFSSCPILEDLTIQFCTLNIKRLSIYVPSLKRLTISRNGRECEWELNVPNVEYIYCQGFPAKWSSVSILKSLNKADIRLYCSKSSDVEDDRNISELVYKCVEVRFLSLANDMMESLARYPVPLPMFRKLTTLKLRIYSYQGWKMLPTILEVSPCLELLTIQKQSYWDYNEEGLKIDKLLPKNIPLCLSLSLKEVQLCSFEGVRIVYDWLGFFSKNANVLEKLTVIPKASESIQIRRQLLAIKRGSNTFEIVVEPHLTF